MWLPHERCRDRSRLRRTLARVCHQPLPPESLKSKHYSHMMYRAFGPMHFAIGLHTNSETKSVPQRYPILCVLLSFFFVFPFVYFCDFFFLFYLSSFSIQVFLLSFFHVLILSSILSLCGCLFSFCFTINLRKRCEESAHLEHFSHFWGRRGLE